MSQNELEFSALHNGKVLVDMKVGGVSVGRFEINPEETSTIARKALVAARVIQDNSGKPLRDPESVNGIVSEVPISGLGIGPSSIFSSRTCIMFRFGEATLAIPFTTEELQKLGQELIQLK